MLSIGSAFYELKNKLHQLYDEREAAAIAHEVMAHITTLSKGDRLLKKDELLTGQQQIQYDTAAKELLNGRPLQYVTGTAWFMGREFVVNEAVLIPRPETEELVVEVVSRESLVVRPAVSRVSDPSIEVLDIGTGSGCIPISLKLSMPDARVTSCDVSGGALAVAKENAARLGADIELVELNFLDPAQHTKLGMYDVIISNPPYIPETEREAMHTNVKDHEPGIALFVPGDDALLFYRAIALFGKEHLKVNGYIKSELAASQAMACKELFEAEGYKDVEIKKDMHGNWRMLKCGIGN